MVCGWIISNMSTINLNHLPCAKFPQNLLFNFVVQKKCRCTSALAGVLPNLFALRRRVALFNLL